MNVYQKGDSVRCTGTWKNRADEEIDPTAVFFKFKDPSGNETSYQYLTDPEIVRESTGVYHVDVDADETGTWDYRFYSTGTGQAAAEKSFSVSSNF